MPTNVNLFVRKLPKASSPQKTNDNYLSTCPEDIFFVETVSFIDRYSTDIFFPQISVGGLDTFYTLR